MIRIEKIISNAYRDSVALMEISGRIAKLPGIARATAVMATEANIALLKETGLSSSQVHVRPNDLLIVIEGTDESSVAAAMGETERTLMQSSAPSLQADATTFIPPRSLQMALEDMPGANLALISTPGEYAAAEAEKALCLGLHVMIFSAHIAIQDELALKQMAHERGLLLMGPDCGSAIVNGIPLGFANVLRRGPIGLVAASGTGLQEVTSLIDRAGIGISQALGCGARDLSEQVGGRGMLDGLAMLSHDASTQVIVLIAKHPAPKIGQLVVEAAKKSGKRAVINFLGLKVESDVAAGIYAAETLEEAAQLAVMLTRDTGDLLMAKPRPVAEFALAQEALDRLSSHQKYIRGLFSGGTFCYESQMLLGPGSVWSNVAIDANKTLSDVWRSREHTLIDMGDEVFTRGRPHPMIDLDLRLSRLKQEANDRETAVILFDAVLGYGAHPNPATEIAAAIASAQRDGAANRLPIFIASVCGTEGDPQDLQQQESILKEAGVLIAPSNAAATRLTAAVIAEQRKRTQRRR
jgi:succinyl-CoA synthetase alpha subunit